MNLGRDEFTSNSKAFARIRQRVAQDGLDAERQTLITLFVCATKAVNLPHFVVAGLGPVAAQAIPALTSHLFRQSDAMTALLRTTQWSPDPRIILVNTSVAAPLFAEFARCGIAPGGLREESINREAAALTHALLATVLLTPLLPEKNASCEGFSVALRRMEAENDGLLEAQIRRLDGCFASVSPPERAAILDAKTALIQGVFERFLDALEEGLA